MYPHGHLFRKQARDSRIAPLFALFIFVLIAYGTFAQAVQENGETPGFTLAASAQSLSIQAGGSPATDIISVTDVNGFTGPVTLTATGAPAGVTATFDTNPATNGSVLTVAAPITTAAATFILTISGVSGTTTAPSVTIAVNLIPIGDAPGFALASSSRSLAVVIGGSVTDTISVIDVNGFNGPVTLSATGAPAGVTATFGTDPTVIGSVLTVSAPTTATPGSFMLIIVGVSGTAIEVITIPVTIGFNEGSPCKIGYTITNQWNTGFQVSLSINNTSTTALNGWSLTWSFADGQTISELWTGQETQSGADVTVNNLSYDAQIPAGGNYTGAGFIANWNGITNRIPTAFSLNGVACN